LSNQHPSLERDDFRRDLARWAAQRLDHAASAFGLPRVPNEAKPPGYYLDTEYLTRGAVAKKFVNIVLDRAMVEAQDWLMDKIEEEGFLSILPILEGQSLFKLVAEFMALKEEEKQSVSSQQAEREGD
jgi:hypothetical protein